MQSTDATPTSQPTVQRTVSILFAHLTALTKHCHAVAAADTIALRLLLNVRCQQRKRGAEQVSTCGVP